MGHGVGDQLICAITDRLKGCLYPGDTLSRFGGDEFVILVDDLSNSNDALRISEGIQNALSAPFIIISCSFFQGAGACTWPLIR